MQLPIYLDYQATTPVDRRVLEGQFVGSQDEPLIDHDRVATAVEHGLGERHSVVGDVVENPCRRR